MQGQMIEGCIKLDIYDVLDKEYAFSKRKLGALNWQSPFGEIISSVGFQLFWHSPHYGELVLSYVESSKVTDPIRLRIALTATRSGFGGQRWWFKCPIGGATGQCDQRVKKLYLPAFATHFGCRACHGLHYRTQYRQHWA